MAFLASTYDLRLVALSLLVASFASYVTLDLAKRVRTPHGGLALGWWLGGSVVMGTGIWAMHFVGMLAFSLPIALGYTVLMTSLSWWAAVATSAVALWIASRGALNATRLALGSTTMGGGICAMHYLGMAAIDILPGIVWHAGLVALSALVAVVASAAALLIFSWLRGVSAARGQVCQVAAAFVMGVAICGMHYTGMAAADFLPGSICLSADALEGHSLSVLVALISIGLLAVTLMTSTLDAHRQGQASRLARSLEIANAGLQAANEALRQQALHDPLTVLPNRLMFEQALADAIAQAQHEPGQSLAVLFIDLDGFKPVNDSFGHATGDVVLKEIAARLQAAAGPRDTLARVGGDEFLLLRHGPVGAGESTALATALIEAVQRPIDAVGHQLEVSASIGIVQYPEQGDPHKLVAQADAAMYAAKRAGGGTCALFDAGMDDGMQEQLSLLSDLRHAIRLRQLQLHYQPKMDARSNAVCGVEALLRWQHPVRGMVSPAVFIPIAERFGLIGAMGNWVLEEACRQLRAWADEQVTIRMAINLSAHQLVDEMLVERVAATLQRHGLDPSQLLCEITESVAMVDIKAAQRTFDGLAGIGVFLAIDDFGTGYSSLSYLRQLPARQLKIDRSFVRDVASSADARAIVDAVVRLAHALSLRVVAEGVETAQQREALLALGCDELQGFYFARPMPAEALLAWTGARERSAELAT